MKKGLLIASLAISVILSLAGLLFKVMHWPFTAVLLSLALITTVAFFVFVFIDIIVRSGSRQKKLLWIGGLIVPSVIVTMVMGELSMLLAMVVAIVYIFRGRKQLSY